MAHGTVGRRCWTDPVQKKLFIDLCLQEVNNGGRSGGTLKPLSWNKIIEELRKQTGKDFYQKQLKNSWDYMKRQYITWSELVRAMGHGFNASTNTVDWPAERCDEYLKTHKEARQYRYKPLPFAMELAALFDDMLAIEAAGEGFHEEEMPKDNDGSPTQSSKAPSDHANDLVLRASAPSTSVSTSTPLSALNHGSDVEAQARGKRRKKEKTENHTLELVKAIRAIIAKADTGPTIEECINSLNEMTTLTRKDELYYVAVKSFCEKKEYREVWMCLKDEEDRISWARSLTTGVGLGKSS